ncbi:PQQ-dependent sugar dehydrogenase, partial [Algoriphagus sp.]|uniref:PQQ-dependent sugar dehydrogenase n=1 Tax=Algoriphagus sp. TaxID=1872435 RepID=UPI0025FFAE6A
MKNNFFLFILLIFTINTACSQNEQENTPSLTGEITVVEAFPKLSFTRPVDFQHAGDNSNRVFVVEQRGVISVFQNDLETTEKTEFLKIENLVDDSGNEEGLLGLAFHPDYKSNGYFYVNYTATNPNRTVISRFSVSSSNPNQADGSSELVLLEFDQPFSNHNGGQISFGPDGYLYIAVGDGGSGGDPRGNGQNRKSLLGSILRIDIDRTEGSKNYAIPSDNPFANNNLGFKEEIYAYGLRNPWRFSFDSANGQLWVGDVGQNKYEEVDIIKKGGNYGWNSMEGFHCFN